MGGLTHGWFELAQCCNDAAELIAGAPDIATGAHKARTALRPAIGEKIILAATERFRRCNGPSGVPVRGNSCSV